MELHLNEIAYRNRRIELGQFFNILNVSISSCYLEVLAEGERRPSLEILTEARSDFEKRIRIFEQRYPEILAPLKEYIETYRAFLEALERTPREDLIEEAEFTKALAGAVAHTSINSVYDRFRFIDAKQQLEDKLTGDDNPRLRDVIELGNKFLAYTRVTSPKDLL